MTSSFASYNFVNDQSVHSYEFLSKPDHVRADSLPQSDLFRWRSGQARDEVAKGLSSRAILNLPAKKERLIAGYIKSEEGVF